VQLPGWGFLLVAFANDSSTSASILLVPSIGAPPRRRAAGWALAGSASQSPSRMPLVRPDLVGPRPQSTAWYVAAFLLSYCRWRGFLWPLRARRAPARRPAMVLAVLCLLPSRSCNTEWLKAGQPDGLSGRPSDSARRPLPPRKRRTPDLGIFPRRIAEGPEAAVGAPGPRRLGTALAIVGLVADSSLRRCCKSSSSSRWVLASRGGCGPRRCRRPVERLLPASQDSAGKSEEIYREGSARASRRPDRAGRGGHLYRGRETGLPPSARMRSVTRRSRRAGREPHPEGTFPRLHVRPTSCRGATSKVLVGLETGGVGGRRGSSLHPSFPGI